MHTNGTDTDIVEEVAARYADRIIAILNRMRDVLIANGYDLTEPYDRSCDDFAWSMSTKIDGNVGEGCFDISIEIPEAQSYGDDEEGQRGINFGINIVEYGGLIVGELQPFNFTDECWVESTDASAVEARFKLIEGADPNELVPLLNNWRARSGMPIK